MKRKSEINICFVMDNGYVLPTCVAVTSILASKDADTRCNVYIICDSVSKESKNVFLELSRDDFKIIFLDLDIAKEHSDLKIENISATPTSISKFLISELLDKVKKVIYLDGDIVVRKDLTELFNIELGDNYVAVVKDVCGIGHFDYGKSDFRYFNSGMMLMNLERMREDGISEKLLEYRLTGYNDMMDQDALNYVLKEHTKIISLKYNTQMNLLSWINQPDSKVCNMQVVSDYYKLPDGHSVDDVLSDAVVIHYATSKPWNYYDVYGNMIWEKYFNLSPCRDIFLSRRSLLAGSMTYKIGRAIMLPFVKLKRLKTKITYRRRRKFLGQFVRNNRGWKYGESDLPKCRNYRGER